jgi:hypothetical protein
MNSPANSPPQNKRGRGRPAKVNKGVVAASQPKAVKKPKSPVKLPPVKFLTYKNGNMYKIFWI